MKNKNKENQSLRWLNEALDESLIKLTPEPWDILSTRFVTDGWAFKTEIVFMDGEREVPMVLDVYGKNRSDMRHIATMAVRKLLVDFPTE
jgi:hypothetical protein